MTEYQSVIERLRMAESVFPAVIRGNHGDGKYFLHCYELAANQKYAIYKRIDDNFIIVDSFSELDDANKEAIEILSKYPNWMASINHHNEFHKKDISEAK